MRKLRKELFDKIKTSELLLDSEKDHKKIDKIINELNTTKKELEHLEKLEAYGRKAFFLENDKKNQRYSLAW